MEPTNKLELERIVRRRSSYTNFTMLPAAIDANSDLSIAVPSANERAIDKSTGPLMADQASLMPRQPVRRSTHKHPRATMSRAFGFCAAIVMVPVRRASASHSLTSPLGALSVTAVFADCNRNHHEREQESTGAAGLQASELSTRY